MQVDDCKEKSMSGILRLQLYGVPLWNNKSKTPQNYTHTNLPSLLIYCSVCLIHSVHFSLLSCLVQSVYFFVLIKVNCLKVVVVPLFKIIHILLIIIAEKKVIALNGIERILSPFGESLLFNGCSNSIFQYFTHSP